MTLSDGAVEHPGKAWRDSVEDLGGGDARRCIGRGCRMVVAAGAAPTGV